ncbi:acyl-CoA synthetase family member 3, mitochondrial [Lingula anatina]|uniref:Acyl-CoA synthetase family member 3, mitochondrial n=1 Tax=Lingula anatina TaxID=7574 RepID=A0A1S3H2X5_LINAN|nr:acyl-CoA synthetase family member 3, mitochondrial [Lingula anatina]|eukprot:XP_013380297.1 acyl-CoA synthetase family member 3, mitochondrial [Lingula anatina]
MWKWNLGVSHHVGSFSHGMIQQKISNKVHYRQFGILLNSLSSCCHVQGSANSRQSCLRLTSWHAMCAVQFSNAGMRSHLACYSSSAKKSMHPDVITALCEYEDRTAIQDVHGEHTYLNLYNRSLALQSKILKTTSNRSLKEARVAFLCPNDISYVVTLYAIWLSGGVAVPLSKTHPAPELEYFIQDSESSLVITTEALEDKIKPVAEQYSISCLTLEDGDFLGETEPDIKKKGLVKKDILRRRALMIYTSGTTGRPKGVVHTFGSLHSQMKDMIRAWEWTENDCVLHVLPLHHVHGIVNVLMTPLFCGATCYMLPEFNARNVWKCLMSSVPIGGNRVNMFMAVPTIYAKLIEEYEEADYSSFITDAIKTVCSSCIRLMVSGSAALPQPVMDRWTEITGHVLLERYGMTETGMALTNPLHGERKPGAVGTPFPSVKARLVKLNEDEPSGYDVLVEGVKVLPAGKREVSNVSADGKEGLQGELQIKGSSLFKEYWNKPEETAKEFTQDGWFKTGDTACFRDGVYKIMGRTSVDIIKSGGYKISALDVERHLLKHPLITDVAVLGLPDMTWGEKVAAVIVVKEKCDLDLQTLKSWARKEMPPYQIPTVVEFMDKMPRNAMGKVNKKDLMKEVFIDRQSD